MKPDENANFQPLSEFLSELTNEARAAHEARLTGRPAGPITGLGLVDRELGGWFQPGLHFVLGAPGAGKSAFALQAAADCGAPALYVSAEQAPVELFRRLIARRTKTFLGRLKNGELAPAEVERLGRLTCEALAALYVINGTATPDAIQDAAETLAEKHGGRPLVVLDSLQAWTRSLTRHLKAGSEYDALEMALAELAAVAADCRAPVLVVSHRNRTGNKASDGGGLFGAKGSGSIEYLSETVLGLERSDDSLPDTQGEVKVSLKVLKNRHGVAGGSVDLRFSGRLQAFREG
jgi:replicative DNA helicase